MYTNVYYIYLSQAAPFVLSKSKSFSTIFIKNRWSGKEWNLEDGCALDYFINRNT